MNKNINWISIKKEGLPNESQNNVIFCFVCFHKGNIITTSCMKWIDTKIWRQYDLENTFTHYMEMPNDPTNNE